MTTISLDFRSILNAAPFNGIVRLAPRNNGIAGCSLYVTSPVEVTLNYSTGTYAPKEIVLTPSSLVGSYNLQLMTSYRKLVYQATIAVPDTGSHCVSDLVGSEVITAASPYVTQAQLADALDGIEGGGATNLTFTRNSTTVTVESDTGTDAVLPAATTSLAGVMAATDKTKLDGIAAGATVSEVSAIDLGNAIDALRSELEMIGTPVSATASSGSAAIITLPALAGQRYALLNVDFSYGPNSGAISGILSITEDAGATTLHRGAVTTSGEGPVPKGALTGINKAVTIQLSGVSGSVPYLNVVYKVV